MLKEIIIKKLFDHFDYRISLKEEGITILTGPNGYGKTTILNIINAIARNNIFFFNKLLFKSISLVFEEESLNVFLEKKDGNTYSIKQGNKKPIIFEQKTIFEQLRPFLQDSPYRQLDDLRWIDRRTDTVLSTELFFQKISSEYPEIVPIPKNLKFPAIPEVYLIKEQRLLRRFERRRTRHYYPEEEQLNVFNETIEEYAKDLKNQITDVLSVYSQKTSELDGSYPSRLFEQTKKVSEDEFKNRFESIKVIQQNINKYEIAEIKEDKHPTYKDEHAKALFVYLDDTEQKLSVFKELLAKLDLFTGLLNKRGFTFKKIEISKTHGFRFKTDRNRPLSLTDLSSGEQQEVVLLYELLFRVKPGTMVLIDEPEISLHVAWQVEFLNDIIQIRELTGIVGFIATHSPNIIGKYWSLTQDLEELSHEKIS